MITAQLFVFIIGAEMVVFRAGYLSFFCQVVWYFSQTVTWQVYCRENTGI